MERVVFVLVFLAFCVGDGHAVMSEAEMIEYRERARQMFRHAYDGYMQHGFPFDEVKPLSCQGFNTWGNFSLTLVDSLSTLIIMGNTSEFENAYSKVLEALDFDKDFVTSVFESNIRVLGGLLSAHTLLHRTTVKLDPGWPCSGRLLDLAVDLADRLLPAFDTPTKMPYGSINLRHGVPEGETPVTCAAGVGTFIVEFGVLSRLTGDMRYENAALAAMEALHRARMATGLVQSHVDVQTGRFTVRESSIGSGMDSYFEYMLKGGVLLHNRHLLDMFAEHYQSIRTYLHRSDWYVVGDAQTGNVISGVYQSLDSFFPGLQTLMGDTRAASRTAYLYTAVWRRFGAVPEMYDLSSGTPRHSHPQYPLRPELIESLMYLYRATGDPYWLDTGRGMLESIDQIAKCPCGYGTVLNVSNHNLEDRMHSYFLSETVKYLYLLFDRKNFIHDDLSQDESLRAPKWTALTPGCQIGVGGYVFSTEAHPFNIGILGCCHRPQQEKADTAQVEVNDETGSGEVPDGGGRRHAKDDGAGSSWTWGSSMAAEDDEENHVQDDDDGEAEESGDSHVPDRQLPLSASLPPPAAEAVESAAQALLATGSQDGAWREMSAEDVLKSVQADIKTLVARLSPRPTKSSQQPTPFDTTGMKDIQFVDLGDLSAEALLLAEKLGASSITASQLAAIRASVGGVDSGLLEGLPKVVMTGNANTAGHAMQMNDLLQLKTARDLISDIDRLMAAEDKGSQGDAKLSDLAAAQAFLSATAGLPEVDANEVATTPVHDLRVSAEDAVYSAGEAIAIERGDTGNKASLSCHIDADIPFHQDFYLNRTYTVPPPGLSSRLEVFGGTVDL